MQDEPRRSNGGSLLRKLFPTRNPNLRNVLATVEKVLDRPVNVLILGESGVGKDLLAEAIHAGGSRRDAPFVKIDCASIPPDLFESELFGYEKGAFTDAKTRKLGRLEQAQRGTVYFDEVAALSPPVQAKLLRVIQERRFTRLGGGVAVDLDVRIISSSSMPLSSMIDSGAFRGDLFYRLNVVSITLPPLRERPEDLEKTADMFLRASAKTHKKKINRFAPEVLDLFRGYSWPGNLRELAAVIDRAVIMESGESITPASLPTEKFFAEKSLPEIAASRQWTLEQLEKEYISHILRQTRENYSRAAEILGINRKTLLEKRKKYGLE